jgi:hypothetical protein
MWPHNASRKAPPACRSRIHERLVEVSGIILRVLRLEVSIYNVYNTSSFKSLLLNGGIKSVRRGECQKQDFCSNYVLEFGHRERNT